MVVAVKKRTVSGKKQIRESGKKREPG